jgi:DNA mismatch endonuclease (patch repair protein)
MADVFDKQKRSAIMAAVKSKNTKAELMVFRFLRSHKIYFQKHYRRVPGSPDVALPRKKRAVFIDGDFWHGRTYNDLLTKHGTDDFWTVKIGKNIKRDAEQRAKLSKDGWQICQVWESDLSRLRTRQEVLDKIKTFLTS